MSEILDIVDEHNEIIGQAERDEVHRLGLVCRLVYICFYTTDGNVILQKRSLTKKNDAGKLTTTVSGHVSSGQTYLEAALRETFEETGIQITPDELITIGTIRADYAQGEHLSNAFRGLFAYKFNGTIFDLKIEDGDGAGFETFSIDALLKLLDSDPEKFSLVVAGEPGKFLLKRIKELL